MSFLEFANPIGWWAALVAIPVVLLYVLKTRLRKQPVTTLLFWDQVFEENRPRAWWQQLRRLMSLLLQLGLLALLVGALVDPLWSWQQQRQRRVVLVIDNSASMQAAEADEQTRLTLAKQAGKALIRSLRGADQMAVLTASGAPGVAIGMTDHQSSLIEAVDELPATDGPTSVAQAVALAQRLLSDSEGEHEIIVLTDGCFAELAESESPSALKLYRVGTRLDNVGITRYQVRRSLLDAVGYQVLVDVTNYSKDLVECRVELNLEDELVDVVPLEIDAGQTVTRVLDHTSASGGRLVAKLNVDDALAVDNRAVALLPHRDPVPVVLVTDGNLFLEQALRSIQLVSLQVVSEAPPAAPAGGVLVLDRQTPAELPAGRLLVIDPQGESDSWTLGDPIAEPIVASVDAESPLTQHVRLTNVLFPEAKEIRFTNESAALIKDPLDNPLMARLPRRGGDAVVLTCSLEKGDLPLRIAFPVLVKNAIEWFDGAAGDLQPATPSGQMATVHLAALAPSEAGAEEVNDAEEPLPASDDASDLAVVESAEKQAAKDYLLVSPSGSSMPISTADESVIVGPLHEAGVWSVKRAGPDDSADSGAESTELATANAEDDAILIACNLANAEESDLRPRSGGADIAELELLSLGGRPLWFYLTFCAAGLVAAEWWLYQRRIVE